MFTDRQHADEIKKKHKNNVKFATKRRVYDHLEATEKGLMHCSFLKK